MESYKLTIHEVKKLIRSRQLSVTELVQGIIHRIERTEGHIGAFITLDLERAMEEARFVYDIIGQESGLSNLGGIPFGAEDNICTKGLRTTAGSRIIDDFIPPYDASVVERLKGCHSILLGKLNMAEFGSGSSTENAPFGSTKNPWDLHKVSGKAAGAAAVASDQLFYAIGSDVAGSLRQSAAFCGVVGFKPTRGLVSRFGQITYGPSMEDIGCITKSVMDCAYVLEEIAFYDERDPISVDRSPTGYGSNLIEDIRGLKIGIPKEIFHESWDSEVRSAINNAINTLEGLGAELVDISLPHAKYAQEAYYIISCCEASSNLGRYDGIRYGRRQQAYDDLEMLYRITRSKGFGDGVKGEIMLGSLFLTPEYYDSYFKKSQMLRALLREDFRQAYVKCQIILTPTSPIPAYDQGSGLSKSMGMDESQRYTLLANMAGLPAISIPCGFNHEGLPIEMQLIGDVFQEETLLRGAYTFERNTDYHMKRPVQLEVGK